MSDIGTSQNAEDFLQMTEAMTATSGQIKIAAAFLNECKKRRGTA